MAELDAVNAKIAKLQRDFDEKVREKERLTKDM